MHLWFNHFCLCHRSLSDISVQILLNEKKKTDSSVLSNLLEGNAKNHVDVELAVYSSLKKW
jgi:hypothetical protein